MDADMTQEQRLIDNYVLVENVAMTFQTRKGSFAALRDINLTVRKGEFVTLIGHSGCFFAQSFTAS